MDARLRLLEPGGSRPAAQRLKKLVGRASRRCWRKGFQGTMSLFRASLPSTRPAHIVAGSEESQEHNTARKEERGGEPVVDAVVHAAGVYRQRERVRRGVEAPAFFADSSPSKHEF